MPLGIDATIRYARNNWSRPLRQSELQADSPYNTRLRRGLPPTPIGNPGLASIRAAANPADTRAIYYVVQALRQRRAQLLVDQGRVRARRRRLQPQARGARRQGPVAVLSPSRR